MILRQVTVKGVKCFRDECRVGAFGEGLNMIFGPNETGKSTLIEATARALFDDYSSKAESIKQLQPWNTSLAPEIVLEFAAADDEFRLKKRLLSDTMCRLERRENGAWSALHERDTADDFVRALLHGEESHGASDLRHWGIARTLWCLNDPCMIGRGDVSCVVPGVVAGQIRSVLGEGTVATALDAVCERIEARYAEYFTARRGDPRAGSRIEELREEIADLEQRRAEAEAALREVEQAAGRLECIELELANLEQEREGCQAQIADYRDEAAEIDALQRAVADIEEKLERARSDRDETCGDLRSFEDARELADDAREKLRAVEERLADLEADLKAAQQLAAEAEDEHAEAREARQEASRRRERGRNVQDVLGLLAERERLTERVAEIEGLREKRDELERRLQETPCPDDAQIERADSLERQVERLQTQLEAAGLAVTVEALREQEVAIEGGDEARRETVAAGDETEYTAGASLTIELPDVARIFVRSGASEPAELQESLTQAREELRELLAPYAASGSADLRDLQRDAERLSDDLSRHDERMQRAAGPFEDAEHVRARQAEVRLELARRLNELELSEDEVQTLDRPDLNALEERLQAGQAEEDRLQDVLDRRRERMNELSTEREGLREERGALEGLARENEATMDTILQRFGCDDEYALRTQAAEAQQAVETLEADLAAEREKLPSEEADPRNLIETAREALAQVDRRKEDLLDQRGGVRQVIERARTEGHYEQLSQIEETLAAKREDLRDTWREAQAVKLLRQIVDRRRGEVVGGALPGLEQKVAGMLRHITGRDRPLRIGEEMVVTGLVDGETVHAPEHLSSGTREQLDLVTRLALGEAYAEAAGRTMMVLDDALLYTDPRRHDRIKQILQRAGEALQVFIVTSHPERYRGIVPEDCCFDLAAIRAGTAVTR